MFWVTNQARDAEADWDLDEAGPEITEGVMERLDGD